MKLDLEQFRRLAGIEDYEGSRTELRWKPTATTSGSDASRLNGSASPVALVEEAIGVEIRVATPVKHQVEPKRRAHQAQLPQKRRSRKELVRENKALRAENTSLRAAVTELTERVEGIVARSEEAFCGRSGPVTPDSLLEGRSHRLSGVRVRESAELREWNRAFFGEENPEPQPRSVRRVSPREAHQLYGAPSPSRPVRPFQYRVPEGAPPARSSCSDGAITPDNLTGGYGALFPEMPSSPEPVRPSDLMPREQQIDREPGRWAVPDIEPDAPFSKRDPVPSARFERLEMAGSTEPLPSREPAPSARFKRFEVD